jgi:hypothetical protein
VSAGAQGRQDFAGNALPLRLAALVRCAPVIPGDRGAGAKSGPSTMVEFFSTIVEKR